MIVGAGKPENAMAAVIAGIEVYFASGRIDRCRKKKPSVLIKNWKVWIKKSNVLPVS
mgnify:CR=1 FL=1